MRDGEKRVTIDGLSTLIAHPSMSDWIGWLETMLEAALMAIAFIAIYEGARRLVAQGLTRWPAFVLAIALVVPVYEASASLKMPGRVRQQKIEQASMRAAEPPGGWEKAPMSPADRTALSANAAMINFMVSGTRQQFIDAAGNRVAFNPTQEQQRLREGLVRDEKGAEDNGQQLFAHGVRLFTSATVFMLGGLVVGLFQRRRRRAA